MTLSHECSSCGTRFKVELGYEAEERQTREYPGCPASVWVETEGCPNCQTPLSTEEENNLIDEAWSEERFGSEGGSGDDGDDPYVWEGDR